MQLQLFTKVSYLKFRQKQQQQKRNKQKKKMDE